MRQIKKDGRLPTEKMTTLAAVLFLPALLIFALAFKGISNWRSGIQSENNRVEMATFVNSAYPPLVDSQQRLLITLRKMQGLLSDVEVLEMELPSHAELIQTIKQKWIISQNILYKVYENTDREVRHAWISHKTLDSRDVLAKFSKQAVKLNSDIINAKKDYRSQLLSAQDDIVKNLDAARQLLDSIRKLSKSKKQKIKNANTLKKIRHFDDRTKANLVEFLGRIDSRLRQEVEALSELIRLSGQQIAEVRAFLLNNQDLEKPLTKVITDWKALEQNSYKRLNQILFATEAEFIALKLGLSQNSPAIKAMHKSLLINLPAIVGKAQKERKSIDQSYNFKDN
jgi:hypothetical protein